MLVFSVLTFQSPQKQFQGQITMKKIFLYIAILGTSLAVNANNFNMPTWGGGNNGSNWNMPNMNWGNNNHSFGNGSNWSIPNMNMGNNNGYRSGSNWSMPNMSWGNNNGSGSSWNMPSMNFGNNNGPGTGSNWNMPNMGWGNSNYNRSNWGMPSFNNGGSNNQPWNNGNNIRRSAPNIHQYRSPAQGTYMIPMAPVKATVNTVTQAASKTAASVTRSKIPTPSEVKGVILAPENKTKK